MGFWGMLNTPHAGDGNYEDREGCGSVFSFTVLGPSSLKGDGQSNTTLVMLKICDIRATCVDSTESSSGPRVLDPYK